MPRISPQNPPPPVLGRSWLTRKSSQVLSALRRAKFDTAPADPSKVWFPFQFDLILIRAGRGLVFVEQCSADTQCRHEAASATELGSPELATHNSYVIAPGGFGPTQTIKMVAPAKASATKMTKLYGFATTFGADLLASNWALTFWI